MAGATSRDTSPDADAMQLQRYGRLGGMRTSPAPQWPNGRCSNVIDIEHACKVRSDRPEGPPIQPRRIFSPAQVALPFGKGVSVVTPEDAVLSKLEWAAQSGESERQLRDVVGILQLNPGIDRAYIERWAEALGVTDRWKLVKQ